MGRRTRSARFSRIAGFVSPPAAHGGEAAVLLRHLREERRRVAILAAAERAGGRSRPEASKIARSQTEEHLHFWVYLTCARASAPHRRPRRVAASASACSAAATRLAPHGPHSSMLIPPRGVGTARCVVDGRDQRLRRRRGPVLAAADEVDVRTRGGRHRRRPHVAPGATAGAEPPFVWAADDAKRPAHVRLAHRRHSIPRLPRAGARRARGGAEAAADRFSEALAQLLEPDARGAFPIPRRPAPGRAAPLMVLERQRRAGRHLGERGRPPEALALDSAFRS